MEVGQLGAQYFQEGEAPQKRVTQRRRLGHDERHSLDSVEILHSSKIVIAEGKGYVLGIGLDWFLCADICICAEDTVLGHPPARMIAATGNTLYWMLRMGPALHAEMCLMGRYIKADEALARGLINRVVPADKLEETVAAAAEAICHLPADGLAIGKFSRKVAWEILGVRASQMQTSMAHALQVQQRIGEDEWHLVREREQHGIKGAYQRRDARFKEALAKYWPEKA
jgi:enoyl-CoA hydratase